MNVPTTFTYERWRHGGWYVAEVAYPEGGCGCVSRSMVHPVTFKADKKWRIACDERPGDHTYPSRDAAAAAEYKIAAERCLRAERFASKHAAWIKAHHLNETTSETHIPYRLSDPFKDFDYTPWIVIPARLANNGKCNA